MCSILSGFVGLAVFYDDQGEFSEFQLVPNELTRLRGRRNQPADPERLEAARKDQRPILLEFYTAWCVYCGKLEKETFGDPRVIDLAKSFVAVRLDDQPTVLDRVSLYAPRWSPPIR